MIPPFRLYVFFLPNKEMVLAVYCSCTVHRDLLLSQ